MSTTRPLTEGEENELAALTAAVDTALAARRSWLDAKMHECSSLQVGDDIYDVDSGRNLGKVSKLYRYHTKRDLLLDDSHYCSYEYEKLPRCFDNTSRQAGVSFGTREDALRCAEFRASLLRTGWGGA